MNTITGERGPRIDLPGVPGLRGELGFSGDPGTNCSSCRFSNCSSFKGSFLTDMMCFMDHYQARKDCLETLGTGEHLVLMASKAEKECQVNQEYQETQVRDTH